MFNTAAAAKDIVHKNYLKNLELPENYRLYQNFPQSFYKVTRIAFEIPCETNVRIVIYAGIYYYKIYADEFVDSKKILLLKN